MSCDGHCNWCDSVTSNHDRTQNYRQPLRQRRRPRRWGRHRLWRRRSPSAGNAWAPASSHATCAAAPANGARSTGAPCADVRSTIHYAEADADGDRELSWGRAAAGCRAEFRGVSEVRFHAAFLPSLRRLVHNDHSINSQFNRKIAIAATTFGVPRSFRFSLLLLLVR